MPHVNHEILRWARETAGLTEEEAVEKLHLSAPRGVAAIEHLRALEAGQAEPTRTLLVKMAKVYRRSLLVFFMSAPPRKGDRGQDFRTLPESHSSTQEALLDVVIRNVKARQGMIRAVLEDEDEVRRLPFVGSASVSDGPDAVLSSIRETLGVDLPSFRKQSSPDEAFALLRSASENAGVFVLLIGDLGSYHSVIDLETFRGFALADDIAPFIIINDHDSRAAWSFTLIHELVHIWLGQTGVSGGPAEVSIERFCNHIAGEFLLPSNEFEQFQLGDVRDFGNVIRQISTFATERNLSSSMVAYRLYIAGIIDMVTWQKCSVHFRNLWFSEREKRREREREQERGPNYYVVRRHRLGAALVNLVMRMMTAGALSASRAGLILSVKPKNVYRLADTQSSGGSRRIA
ncbi:MAG: XRE family transcriptional regulator [bacterium]|nr:XRE family transcriptional regulator [bacterium]